MTGFKNSGINTIKITIFFTLLNLLKVPPYVYSGLITTQTLALDARYLVFIPMGVGAGWLANRALPQKVFEYLVYVLLIVTSLQLVLGSAGLKFFYK